MSTEQLFINKRYFDQRLASTASVNQSLRDGNASSSEGFSGETGVMAAFFESIGIKQLPSDLGPMIEVLFASSFAKIFTFGFNTLPNADWKMVFGALSELGFLNTANPASLAIGNYSNLQASLISKSRRN